MWQDELARIDAELDMVRGELIRLEARQAGLLAERNRLAAASGGRVDRGSLSDRQTASISNLGKNEAIVAVLGNAEQELSIDEVVAALRAAGRGSETYNVVAIYLDNLVKEGRVRRVRRGFYSTP